MILVTGASGQLGSLTIKELLKGIPATELAALFRNKSDKSNELEALGVEVRIGSYDDSASLLAAFQNVDTLFFVSSAESFQNREIHGNVIRAAVEAGVKRIVYTSTQRKTSIPYYDQIKSMDIHGWTEDRIKESGLNYTILRNSPYMESIPLILGSDITERGFHMPMGNGAISFASRRDMARGAAKVLSTPGHDNKIYEFGGVRSIGFEEIVRGISGFLKSTIGFSVPDRERFIQERREAGDPEELIMGQLAFADQVREGYFDNPSNDLSYLLAGDLMTVEDYLKEVYQDQK